MKNKNCIILHIGNKQRYLDYLSYTLYQLNKLNINIQIFLLKQHDTTINSDNMNEWLRYYPSLNIIEMDSIMSQNGFGQEIYDKWGYQRITWMKVFSPFVTELNTFEKILYLDSDIVIKEDISKIFNICMDKYFIGCAEDVNMVSGCNVNYSKNTIQSISDELFPSQNRKNNSYYNCGLILFNNYEIQKRLPEYSQLLSKGIRYHYEKKFVFVDQDMFNVCFEIFHIPNIYNKQPKYEDCSDALIEHYACAIKPEFDNIIRKWREEQK